MTTENKERLAIRKRGLTVEIVGNIGVGKTTYANFLAERWGNTRIITEDFEENPYLEAFYKDPHKNSLRSEFWFLTTLFQKVNKEIKNPSTETFLMDPGFFGHRLYKEAHLEMEWISKSEGDIYDGIFREFLEKLKEPDVILFLVNGNIDSITENIEKRGRKMEEQMDRVYIKAFNKVLSDFAIEMSEKNKPIYQIDTSRINYADKNFKKVGGDFLESIGNIENAIAHYALGFGEGDKKEKIILPGKVQEKLNTLLKTDETLVNSSRIKV